jgi:hypothetical protein
VDNDVLVNTFTVSLAIEKTNAVLLLLFLQDLIARFPAYLSQ